MMHRKKEDGFCISRVGTLKLLATTTTKSLNIKLDFYEFNGDLIDK